ncbi:hypothetical protein BJY04DRAFT_182146 [Aspergillus karnatakaensis]|uniref:putative C2H2 transcription factor (Swi5) n=1 Tax=Aspergillus karnatakaensis TaxID=1810916 RepID=UPI003CCD49F0
MLSNPHSSLHGRHRQHRRQISTPNALDAVKPPSLLPQAMHRYHAHRRGQSLDQRAVQAQRPQLVQDASYTNQTAPQYLLNSNSTLVSMMPDCQVFGQEDLQALTNADYQASQNLPYLNTNFVKANDQARENRPQNYHFNLIQQQQQQLHNAKLGCTTALENQLIDNASWDMYGPELAPSIQHHSNATSIDMRRHSMQSNASSSYRQHTPRKTNTQYFPISPATTPFNKTADIAQYCSETQLPPATSQNVAAASSQSSYMQRAKSLQGVAGTTFTQPKIEMPSPPNTDSFAINGFDSFDYQQGSNFDILESEDLPSSQYSASSTTSSLNSPEIAAIPSSEDRFEKQPKVPICPATPSRLNHRRQPSTPTGTSITKAKLSPRLASIDNLNLDARVHASIKETGVTIDEIAAYIHGPDPEDGKWVCLHPGCERRFGRKENIKSHVQTHLGDRQYKCDHCDKCFVRGHDLKRHAKIHTGDKPYECLCGNVFARHDALTRHRQRGMCVGGYKGIVRKTTKRGRPKKHRPEVEERRDKATKTRQRIAEKSSSSDTSSRSDTSRHTPPSEVFENMSIHGSSSADEMVSFDNPNYLPPEVFTFTPPESPNYGMGSKPRSPRSLTPSSEDEMLPLSPSKRSLEDILEESGLPPISTAGTCSFSTVSSSSSHALSSPHTAPTLSDGSQSSDLDIFIHNEPSSAFSKHDFSDLSDPDMATFPDYVNTSSFDSSLDMLQGKNFSTNPSMGDDFFSFQFQVDDQPSDVMSREFFLD